MIENNANEIPEVMCPYCGCISEDMEIYNNVSSVIFDCPCGWSAEIKQ